MLLIAVILAVAAVVWGAIYAHRGSLALGCGLLIVVSYALGHEFWHAKIGPLPLTLDRFLLIGLAAAFAIRRRYNQLAKRAFTASDWMLAATVALFAVSAAFSGQPDITDGVTSKWGRLVTSFVIPAAVYFALRHAKFREREARWLLAGFVAFGVYLAFTAFMEITGRWSMVFPRYISNPNLGIHFGRARGPELNSVSLGAYLTACCLCAWMLLAQARGRFTQLITLAALPLMAAGVYFTYTRSTYIGLAAAGLVVVALEIPKHWRLPAVTLGTIFGLLIVATSWSHLMGIHREGTVADSEHSVDQRKSFAYVSWKMFCDHPILGVGFGRFYDRKLEYLSDRSQKFELESIRPLHHHNTILSVLTETGLVGLVTYGALLAVWAANAWRLARSANLPRWSRALGVLMLALLANYLSSALFHDLTLLPSQHLLLFAFAAIAVNVRQGAGAPAANEIKRGRRLIDWHDIRSCAREAGSCKGVPASGSHVHLFGIDIARVTLSESVEQVLGWCSEPRADECRYVVTPNVDHAVMFQERADLRAAYADASLVVADGAPIVLASKILRRPLPERVAGSDLVPQLFHAAQKPLRVFLLGAAPGVAERAARQIESSSPSVQVVGCYSPPLGFEKDDTENARILAAVAAAQTDLLIVGFGAPKQELWVHRHRRELEAKVALCAGATIDFLAGNRQRSPVWMQRTGLEWLHRLYTEPRRLASRYARDAWIFPQLVWHELRVAGK